MPGLNKKIVAFQGELGAFSHAAAIKLVGTGIKLFPLPSFGEVFEAVDSRAATHAVIPIENTLHGSVHENYDHLLKYDLGIAGETSIQISHQLIALPGVSLGSIREVYSHPVALNQCRQFFERHPGMKAVSFYDTAGSVKALMGWGRRDAAAIASSTAADTYGGAILRRDIEDVHQNFTRFFLLTKQLSSRTRAQTSKTSVVFSTENTPGALFRAMACFALRDLSLTKIESRPLRDKPWEYFFYVDFLGSVGEKKTESALANLRECTQFVRILGSYRPRP